MQWISYCVACSVLSIFIFLKGFFPFTHTTNIISELSDVPRLENSSYNMFDSSVKKTVIMVIDALRYDFLSDQRTLSKNMPFLTSLMTSNEEQVCLFKCRVHLPTVTMPRIKAMMTGTVSNFIDLVLNLGSSELHQDNLLVQLKNVKKKIIFYGDDTWLKLFPRTFSRYEGTTSFFVSDFVEVDSNVTRNVVEEVKKDDWDMMILHYLGLDHIGHLEGPSSPKIPWKLQEMDNVIRILYEYLRKMKTNGKNESYLMIICGDHGMKDSGGHGGSSIGEILTPLVSVGLSCAQNRDDIEINQIDVAVTLSLLLSTPLPHESIGRVIPGLAIAMEPQRRLLAYHYNAVHLLSRASESHFTHEREELKKATELHKQFLNNDINKPKAVDFEAILKMYMKLISSVSSELVKSLIRFDVPCLCVAIVIMSQTLLLTSLPNSKKKKISKKIIYLIFGLLCGVAVFLKNYDLCQHFEWESILCENSVYASVFKFILMFVISSNFYLIASSVSYYARQLRIMCKMVTNDKCLGFLIIASALQAFSLLSTSFIEEEHMTWYYFWSTFLCFLLFLDGLPIDFFWEKKRALYILVMLILHRILQTWNQTGDQWITVPDMGDWLRSGDNISYLSLCAAFGLGMTYVSSYILTESIEDRNLEHNCFSYFIAVSDKIMSLVCLITVYCYRTAVDDLIIGVYVQPILSHRGIFEFELFTYSLIASVLLKMVKCVRILMLNMCRKICFSVLLSRIFIEIWILVVCLVSRPHNLILPASLILVSWLLKTTLKYNEKNWSVKLAIAHHWLAHVYFFYQGNSNGLASVDIAAGYIGQSSYNLCLAATLVYCCTYSMPILTYALLINKLLASVCIPVASSRSKDSTSHIVNRSLWSKEELRRVSKMMLSAMNFQICSYLVIMNLQKHHLFIWSVFSPKLLYICVHAILVYVMVCVLSCFAKLVHIRAQGSFSKQSV